IVLLLQSSTSNLEALLTNTAVKLEKIFPVQLHFFFGGTYDSLNKISDSYTEAEFALKNAKNLEEIPRISYYNPQGLLNQLFNQIEPEFFHYFSTSILKELAFPKEEALIDLQKTLNYYLDNQCEITKTAHDLFIHRNTVKYRIERCEQIIGQKISDPKVSLNVRLALEAVQLGQEDIT
ncbi:MAG: helix-turn-helix domain-containing protein, partial [Pisciglobus halotolerans]|nr:helix-turn-helix domain-containing protein [Pisciglobus halotolerans]